MSYSLLALLNESFENNKYEAYTSFYRFEKMSLINPINHDFECEIIFIT